MAKWWRNVSEGALLRPAAEKPASSSTIDPEVIVYTFSVDGGSGDGTSQKEQ
jgi:hypothetical protein